MNKVTQERVAEKVLKAISDEGLSNMEAGKILGIKPNYLSMIKRDTYYDKTPRKAWDLMKLWVDSGTTLKGYGKKPKDYDTLVPELDDEDSKSEEPKKDICADLARAKYIPPERGKGKELPPIVKEAMARKIQKDLANAPIIQDVILNIKVKLSIE